MGRHDELLTTDSQLHPFCQQKDIVEYCDKNGLVIEAYCPLIRGGWNDTIVDIGKKVCCPSSLYVHSVKLSRLHSTTRTLLRLWFGGRSSAGK